MITDTLIVGGGGTWTTMSEAAAQQLNITAEAPVNGVSYELVCSAGEITTDNVNWTGWTNDAAHRMLVRANAGDETLGVPGAGFKYTFDGGSNAIAITQDYITFQDIEISAGNRNAIQVNAGLTGLNLSRLIITQTTISTARYAILLNSGQTDLSFTECLVRRDNAAATGIALEFNLDQVSAIISGNTIYSNTVSLAAFSRVGSGGDSGVIEVENNTVVNVGAGAAINSNVDLIIEFSAISDATATNPSNTTGVVTTLGTDFVDFANGDYNVQPGGKLDGNGTTPSATLDITLFANNNPSDCGAWALQGAGPIPAVLDTPTVTAIAQTTATIGCTTDTAVGTLYWTVTESATAIAADIKAGTGVDSGNLVPTLGINTDDVIGLTADTAYYHHWVQVT